MADTSVVIDSDLVGGLQEGTFAFTFVASDVSHGALISNQTDGFDSTIVTLGQGRYPEEVDPGHIFFRATYNRGAIESNAALTAGVEHTVVITFDASHASIFIDGERDNRQRGDFSIPACFGSIAAIGNWLSGGQDIMPPFEGTISQTYLFDMALGRVRAEALSSGTLTGPAPTLSAADDGQGNMTIFGGSAGIDIFGTDQNDRLFGKGGDDRLEGGRGQDALDGGSGSDHLLGGRGADLLAGGLGADVFHFTSTNDFGHVTVTDRIIDFVAGKDMIDLGDAGSFTFIGSASFGGHAGELRFGKAFEALLLDLDGDGRSDRAIVLEGVTALTAADLIL